MEMKKCNQELITKILVTAKKFKLFTITFIYYEGSSKLKPNKDKQIIFLFAIVIIFLQ